MTGYVEQAGLLSRYSVDGIQTAQGSYNLTGATQGQLGWSGVGQYNDLVNPCAMMVWMGAVANGGKAAVPHLIQEVDGGLPQLSLPFGKETGTLIQSGTARTLADMMAPISGPTPGLWASCATRTPPTPSPWWWRRGAAAPARRAMWPPRC